MAATFFTAFFAAMYEDIRAWMSLADRETVEHVLYICGPEGRYDELEARVEALEEAIGRPD